MSKLYFLTNFNNYHNRVLRRFETVQEYIGAVAVGDVVVLPNANFNPNDGVTSEHIVNSDYGQGEADYLLVCDETDNILSRWFILENQRTRAKQYRCSLRRDLGAEYYPLMLNAPSFIEKGTPAVNSPLIFNGEEMSFNEVKTGEFLIKDASKVSWVVMYLANDVLFPEVGSEKLFVIPPRTDDTNQGSIQFTDNSNDTSFTSKLRKNAQETYLTVAFPYSETESIKVGDYELPRLKYSVYYASAFARRLASYVYDVQLLPYCPIPGCITNSGDINLSALSADEYYWAERSGTLGPENTVFCLLPKKTQFTFSVYPQEIATSLPALLAEGLTAKEKKVKSLTRKFRLCSPNYASIFEFDAQKNNGVGEFRVDCAYRPTSPYMHITFVPNSGGLYGVDTHDARGLICQGDFSLPRVNDTEAEYAVQNRYYQDIFNRRVQNMERNNTWAMAQSGVSALTGAAGASAIGAKVLGGALGPALAPGLAGAVSLGAGVIDQFAQRDMQKEALDFAKDNFGYDLATIKARPDSVSNLQAFTPNHKIFPVLEVYDCTADEKEALENKLQYNGYSIGVVGTMDDFVPADNEEHYIKGVIIRADGFACDFHSLASLNEEYSKGWFITRVSAEL